MDARTAGRLTTDEVDTLIEKAEKMKFEDEIEENRANSLHKLEGLCGQIRIAVKKRDPIEVEGILQDVRDCTVWIKENQNALESEVVKKYDKLSADALIKSDINLNRSTHVFEMSQLTAKYYMDKGTSTMSSPVEEDVEEAVNLFRKAFNIASGK